MADYYKKGNIYTLEDTIEYDHGGGRLSILIQGDFNANEVVGEYSLDGGVTWSTIESTDVQLILDEEEGLGVTLPPCKVRFIIYRATYSSSSSDLTLVMSKT